MLKNKIIENIKRYERFIKFAIVGCSNLTISLLTYYLLLFIKLDYQIANMMSFIAGSANGYFWNKHWVFQKRKENHLLKFYCGYLLSWLLSAGLLFVWVEGCGISQKVAPLINVMITTPINYFVNKIWVFKSKDEGQKVDIKECKEKHG